MHYSVILNPTASNGHAKEVWGSIKQQFEQAGVDFDLQTTKKAADAEYFTRRLCQQRRASNTTVVVVGGDGTLHDVLNGLEKAARSLKKELLPLAYIPTSNLSRFAQAYGISLDPNKALQQVLGASQVEKVIVGHCNDAIKNQHGYFLNSIGIGFDAALLSHSRKAKRRKKFRWRRFSFLSHALSVIYDQQPFQLMVTQQQHRFLYPKAYIVLIANHPYLDCGVKLSSANNLTQPSLELLTVERRGWPITFWQLLQLYRGKLGQSRFANHLTANNLHLTTTSLEFSQTDGEDQGNRFIDITVDVTTYPFRELH